MPRLYSSPMRRQIVARILSGQPVAVVAAETGVCQATLFRWEYQAFIDAGVIEGTPNVEADAPRRHSYLGNINPAEFQTLWTSTYSIPQLA